MTEHQRTDRRQLFHDLRNALNAIVTSGRCLARCDELSPTYERFVVAISKNGERASELLNDLQQSCEGAEPTGGA